MTSKSDINDGGAAFPGDLYDQGGHINNHGISLRAYFAGQAMAAGVENNYHPSDTDIHYNAKLAVRRADALITELGK